MKYILSKDILRWLIYHIHNISFPRGIVVVGNCFSYIHQNFTCIVSDDNGGCAAYTFRMKSLVHISLNPRLLWIWQVFMPGRLHWSTQLYRYLWYLFLVQNSLPASKKDKLWRKITESPIVLSPLYTISYHISRAMLSKGNGESYS
jgi:hypothetical protein